MEAENELNRRHSEASWRGAERLDDFLAGLPGGGRPPAHRLHRKSSGKAELRGTDVRAPLEALKAEKPGLQRRFCRAARRTRLLRAADIEPQYVCPKCERMFR